MSFTQKMRQALLRESKIEEAERIAEISSHEAESVMGWFNDDKSQLSFDELFDGKLRKVVSLRSQDAMNLRKTVEYLRAEDWSVGVSAEWDGGMHNSGNFPVKKVKQKRTRLQAQGGGEYEEEVEVAELRLERRRTITIPKGPRAGETIEKTDKTTMSKAIFKNKKISQQLKDWWKNKQVFYTKERQWKTIEAEFVRDLTEEDPADNMAVVISRHPLDVLRMSDHRNIQSCHSEGSSYFYCAQHEARGHGPIAYLVDSTELSGLLAGIYKEYDTAEDPEAAYDENRLETIAKLGAETWLKRHILPHEKYWRTMWRSRDDPNLVEFGVDMMTNNVASYKELPPSVRGVLTDQVILDACIYVAENADWAETFTLLSEEEKEEIGAPTSPAGVEIGELDDEEIFRDRDRGVKGIRARARVRLRRYEDRASDVEFAVPERRVYGEKVPGFLDAVTSWSWQAQSHKFESEDSIPQAKYLLRTGGSYEDTSDFVLLKAFFRQGHENAYEGQHGNVSQDSEGEEDHEQLWEEYEERCQELQDYANNNLTAVSVSYEVGGDEQPYVSAWGSGQLRIMLDGWPTNGPETEDSSYKAPEGLNDIPLSWGGDYSARREFEDLLEPTDAWPDEYGWDLDGRELTIDYSFTCDDCGDPDDFENFIDYLENDFDSGHEELAEKIRIKLVKAGYAKQNYFDKYAGVDEDGEDISNAAKFAESLTHFRYIGADTGETSVSFSSKNDNGTQHYIATPVTFPRSMWRGQSPDARDMHSVFGGTVTGHGLERYIQHSRHASEIIAAQLAELEKEANKAVADQLQLDFGDPKYDKPEDSFGVDLANQAKFGTFLVHESEASRLGLPNAEQLHYLGFALRVLIESADTEEEIKGAILFIKYIDDHIDELKQVMSAIYQEAIDDELNQQKEAAKYASSDLFKDGLIANLTARYDYADDVPMNDPRHNPHAARARAFVMWTNEVWSELNDMEKRVLTKDYIEAHLTGMGDLALPDHADPKLPSGWVDHVKKLLTQAGAPGVVANRYSPSFSSSYAKLLYFWTNPHNDRFDNIERIEDMRNQVDDDFVPMPVLFESMTESTSYHQSEYEILCGVAMAKELGGSVEQTLKDIRAVEAVTIVDTVEGTSHDTDTSHNVDLTIKFVRNQRSKPYRFIRYELVPQLRAVKGLGSIRVKNIRKTGR
jgi:hypothetical protein